MTLFDWLAVSLAPDYKLKLIALFYEVINDKGFDGATEYLWSCGVIQLVLMARYFHFDE